MKTLSIITIVTIIVIAATSSGIFIEKMGQNQRQPYASITINGIKENYTVGEPISFSVTLEGYGTGCGDTKATVTKENDTSFQPLGWANEPSCVSSPNPSDFKFTALSGHAIINQTGNYMLKVTFDNPVTNRHTETEKRFLVMPYLLTGMATMSKENDAVFSIPTLTNETIYRDYPNPPEYSIIDATQGIAVSNDAEASNLTGFSVKSPTDLPQGYKVQLIKASKEIPMVTIFVSKYPLTENTTSEDFFWNQQGILITYDKTGPHELENSKHFWGASTNKTITIAGTPAEIFDISKAYHDGYTYDMWGSLLAIQNNDTSIGIDGFLNSDDFIKIATSMLEK